jgi:chemotaxis protein methyltransferase CheR
LILSAILFKLLTVAIKLQSRRFIISLDPISAEEFGHFRRVIYDHAGIALAPKKIMAASRLAKRLLHFGLQTYRQYYQLLNSGQHPHEFQLRLTS